jgi:hypothetical protein
MPVFLFYKVSVTACHNNSIHNGPHVYLPVSLDVKLPPGGKFPAKIIHVRNSENNGVCHNFELARNVTERLILPTISWWW